MNIAAQTPSIMKKMQVEDLMVREVEDAKRLVEILICEIETEDKLRAEADERAEKESKLRMEKEGKLRFDLMVREFEDAERFLCLKASSRISFLFCLPSRRN